MILSKKEKDKKMTWSSSSQKRKFKWPLGIWRGVAHPSSSGKSKMKTSNEVPLYTQKNALKNSWQYQVLMRMRNNSNSHVLLLGDKLVQSPTVLQFPTKQAIIISSGTYCIQYTVEMWTEICNMDTMLHIHSSIHHHNTRNNPNNHKK